MAKHKPYEVCDCPNPKPDGRPYHCAAGEPLQPRGYTREEINDALDEGGPMFFLVPAAELWSCTKVDLPSPHEFVPVAPLAGWQVGAAAFREGIDFYLMHRCGFAINVPLGAYLHVVIAGPVAEHHRQGCGS